MKKMKMRKKKKQVLTWIRDLDSPKISRVSLRLVKKWVEGILGILVLVGLRKVILKAFKLLLKSSPNPRSAIFFSFYFLYLATLKKTASLLFFITKIS